MANISKNEYGDIIIDGPLINDDIVFLNRIETNATIVLKNTKGLTTDILKQITNPNLRFSVMGGLDPVKRKYEQDYYQKRTFHSRDELIKIIEYFEYIEKNITDDMSEIEKCMYIYCCIIKDTNYVTRYRDEDLDSKLIENTLTGNLYHKLTCAGIALTYKELLDRQGIKCEYLNKSNSHSFNRIEIDGKKYGIDLTWDLTKYERESKYAMAYFGRQNTKDFYVKHHDLSNEEDETMDELSTFSYEELVKYGDAIKPVFSKYKKHVAAVDTMTKEEKVGSLKIHHDYNEAQREYSFLKLIKFLINEKIIPEGDYRRDFYDIRNPVVGDIVGAYVAKLDDIEGLGDEFAWGGKISNDRDKFVSSALKAIDEYIESYIKDFFEMSALYADIFKFTPAEEDVYLNLYYGNIDNKIRFFNSVRQTVYKMGYEDELKFFNFVAKREKQKEEEYYLEKYDVKSQYDNDYDFLSGMLNAYGMLDIKDYIESQKGKEISIDEFKELFTNASYMKGIFKNKWDFNDEELSKLLNESYNENIDMMIEMMNERNTKGTIEEEVSKKVDPTIINNNDSYFDDNDFGFDFDPDEFKDDGKFI